MIKSISYYLAKIILRKTNTNTFSSKSDDCEILQYGLECIINTVLTSAILLIFAIFTNDISSLFVWLFSFLILRYYIGGYHANSHFACILFSCFIGILSLLLASNLSTSYIFVKIIILLFFLFIYFLIGPILQNDTYNSQYTRLRKRGLVVIIFDTLIIFIFLCNKYKSGNTIFVGTSAAFILYILEILNRKIKKMRLQFR